MKNSISSCVSVHKLSSNTRSDRFFELRGDVSLFEFDLRYDIDKRRWYWVLRLHPFPRPLIISHAFVRRCDAVEDVNAFIHSYLKLYQDKVFEI